jgi:uncharacterized UBP type Zn finger protein
VHSLAYACTLPEIKRFQPPLRLLLAWSRNSPIGNIVEPENNIEHVALKLIKSFRNPRLAYTFPIGLQHCAKELLSNLLDVESSCLGISDTKLAFSGSMVNLLNCPNPKCDARILEEPFSLIELPLPPCRKITTAKLSLTSCLAKYFDSEKLPEDARFHCPSCPSKLKGQTRKSILSHVNQGLIISLQRSRTGGLKDKTAIDFPLCGLDISEISFPPVIEKFDLHAVVLHCAKGNLSTQGHYRAACLDVSARQWLMFNDGHPVRSLSDTSAELNGNGEEFIFFYRRRSPKPQTELPC